MRFLGLYLYGDGGVYSFSEGTEEEVVIVFFWRVKIGKGGVGGTK